jgi:hypothetical protein
MSRAGRETGIRLRRLARATLIAVTIAGSGCAVLPQLPASRADQPLGRAAGAGMVSSVCAVALHQLSTEPTREVRLRWPAPSGSPGDAANDADLLIRHSTASRGTSDQSLGAELVLRNVRDLAIPRAPANVIRYGDEDGAGFARDRRSTLADATGVVEATVYAADLAYDIEEQEGSDHHAIGRLDPDAVARQLPGYRVQHIYIDRFSGLKAVAFESRRSRHRIYAIAGTQVFVNRDYRDWASGLMMARSQFVSDANLRLVADAAAYARDLEHGGEVFFTGQSQGAIISQALGFLVQDYLNTAPDRHRLVHVVAWGVAGATEAIVETIERSRNGYGRDVWPALERHWRLTDRESEPTMRVWNDLAMRWYQLDDNAVAEHVRAVAAQMHVIGYFFDIDPFARIGTFLGERLVFPAELVLPQHCEELVTELVFDTRIGDYGLRLESHFLKGYRRAVERGAVGVARPARIAPREWVLNLVPLVSPVGRFWLRNIYLASLGEDEGNWQRCFAADRWITDRNRDCRQRYWPGCSPADGAAGAHERTAEDAGWCLVADPVVRQPSERSRR